ncbi:MAG: TlpA family protein disulfide reductase [Bacteroidales bacterium]|nr:TlpA family protein disulfide reductase [Bacteroidales bacterium]
MDIKQKFNNYLKKKSKFSIATDILIFAFIIALIFPSSRIEVMAFVNKIRVAIVQPDLKNEENAVQLTENDFAWTFEDMNGTEHSLNDYKGKVLFINLWATWCPPCVAEMPSIQKLYNKFKNNNQIEFLIISSEKPEIIKKFIQKRGFTFPVKIAKYQLPDALYTQSIPTTFLISKSGKIKVKEVGAANWGGSKMEKIVNDLIDE